MARISRVHSWLLMGVAVAITTAIYWGGLHGGFVYDDMSFLVGNLPVQVATLHLADWVGAAFSFPGGVHQGRWLGMLSFAANYYFGGSDPFGFKLTNLVIHLLNGVLVFLALRALFDLRKECDRGVASPLAFDGALAAAAIASLWLVLPINLTGILYVSQRLESLSATFVFLGLWWYLSARRAHWRGERGTASLWMSLLVCSGIGVLVKESAVMLPLYAACADFVVTRWHNRTGQRDHRISTLYIVLLGIPLVAGSVWLLSWVFGPQTYSRPFGTWERLLSESRVLIEYGRWTLAPSLDALTLYHDDIEISRGLLSPPTTLAACAALLALLTSAFWECTRRPLYSIGVLWFFCGHLLTATIIPLLLAFEHRNYFASLGLLLAVSSLLALERGLLRRTRICFALTIAVFSFFAFTTWMRAEEWSDPMRLAISEASKRPDSQLAQYDRASALISAGTYNGRPVLEDGLLALDDNRHLANASIMYEQVLITTYLRIGSSINPNWWTSLVDKLRSRPPTISDAKALGNLNGCFIDKKCAQQDLGKLADAYDAALSFPSPSPALLSVHAEFAWYLRDDKVIAERDIRNAVRAAPLDLNARRNLAILLIATGQVAEARQQLSALRKLNYFGMLDKFINPLEDALRDRERAQPAQ